MHQHRRGPRAGPLAALLRNRPGAVRAVVLVLTAALLFACWAASWAGRLVYPVSVQQAAQWRPQTDAAAAALVDAPLVAKAVELVISRFSGNLSWVPGVVQLMGVTSVVVYCKARGVWAAQPLELRPNAERTLPQNPAAPPAAVPCTRTLPNVGNEGHTYLWHITEHWDNLPDLLLFLPDTVEYGDKLKTWRRVKVRPLLPVCTPPRRQCGSRECCLGVCQCWFCGGQSM